jgi:hypothetical protein
MKPRWQCHRLDRNWGGSPCRPDVGQTCRTAIQVRPERADRVSLSGIGSALLFLLCACSTTEPQQDKPKQYNQGGVPWVAPLVAPKPLAPVLPRQGRARERQALFEVQAKLPLDAAGIAAAADVLEGLAEGARAFWGRVLPKGFGSEVAQQMRRSTHGPERSPRGLPMLNLPEKLRSPEIPHYLGWLNYWSAAAAQAIGFPDPARDAELLSRARRTETGGGSFGSQRCRSISTTPRTWRRSCARMSASRGLAGA